MALLSTASLVAAVFVCAASAIQADVCQLFGIDVRLRVDRSLTSKEITDLLKTEAEAIWRPYGVRLQWNDAGGGAESAASGVSLDASLEREFKSRRPMEWPAVLGRTVVRPGAPKSALIRVSFDATENVLEHRITGRPSGGTVLGSELARALGRVLAHEIGHVLLGPDHDAAGLMRASLLPEELGEVRRTPFMLTCGSAGRLRTRLRTLAEDQPVQRQHSVTTLDLESVRPFEIESSAGASCISEAR